MSVTLVIGAVIGAVLGTLHFFGREYFRRRKDRDVPRQHCTCPTCGRVLSPMYPSFCFACGEVLPNDYDPYAGLAERVETSVILGGADIRFSVHQGREYGRACFFASLYRWPTMNPRKSATALQVYQDETMLDWDNLTFAEWLAEVGATLYDNQEYLLHRDEDFEFFVQELERTVADIEESPRRYTLCLDRAPIVHYVTVQEVRRSALFWKEETEFNIAVRKYGHRSPETTCTLPSHPLGPRSPKEIAGAIEEFLEISSRRQTFLNVPDEEIFAFSTGLLHQMDSVASIIRSRKIIEESLEAFEQLEGLESLGPSILGCAAHLSLVKQGRDDVAFLIGVADGIDQFPPARIDQFLSHFEELMDAFDPQRILRMSNEGDRPRSLLAETLSTLQSITLQLNAIHNEPEAAWVEYSEDGDPSHAAPPSVQ